MRASSALINSLVCSSTILNRQDVNRILSLCYFYTLFLWFLFLCRYFLIFQIYLLFVVGV